MLVLPSRPRRSRCQAAVSFFAPIITLLACALIGIDFSLAAEIGNEPAPPKATKPGARKGRGYEMDYGSALSYTINCKQAGSRDVDDLVLKGVAVRVSKEPLATICFDTELLRYAAGWTNGFLDISRTHLNSSKGTDYAYADGDVQFRTKPEASWSPGTNSTAPRSTKYHGFYRSGEQIVFTYSVNGTEILDLPGYEEVDGIPFFSQTLSVAPHGEPISVKIADPRNGMIQLYHQGISAPAKMTKGQVFFPGSTNREIVKILLSSKSSVRKSRRKIVDPAELCSGGPANWPQVLETVGRMGTGKGPYAVDTLTMPEQNPWKSWLRFCAFDFFSDGRAAISTWSGDIWIISGIDNTLRNLKWKRYAAGLFEALGLKIVEDVVYVTARDRIVRLHDLNHDGEADFYESFNSDAPVAPSYHAFAFDLQTDRAGNFYYVRCGQRVDPALPLHGGMLKVSKDGANTELIASGLRAANGMAIGPNDEIVCSDNQGNWTPSSRINLVQRGKFYGYVPHSHTAEPPTDYEKPICWLPMSVDNSSGGETWVNSDRWGPFKGELLHTSYGRSALFLLMMETAGERAQGGIVQFPLRFESGIMRARFHPLDGQLYVCGLQGWQTVGLRDGAFQRVRYTGGPVYMPSRLHVKHDGLEVGFTSTLDKKSAEDPENFAVEAWNYRWTEAYGSPEYSVKNPEAKQHDKWAISAVHLGADGKTLKIDLPEIRPVMQMKLQFRIRAEDGAPVAGEIYNTINWVP